MKRFGSAVLAGVVMATLVACSGGPATDGPATTGAAPTGATTDDRPLTGSDAPTTWAEGERLPGEVSDPCPRDQDVNADITTTFGELTAASDEWSAAMGVQWRHYYPMTITNVSAATCFFRVGAEALIDGEREQLEEVNVVLRPGQSYSLQVFELAGDLLTADSPTATPVVPIEPSHVISYKRYFHMGIYDADFTFGAIEGSGATATLPLTITYRGLSEGWPKRASSSTDDNLWVNGLDAQGNVVATVAATIDPLFTDEETRVIHLPVGGGTSSGIRYNNHTEADFRSAVSFEVVDWSPSAVHRKELG